MYIEKLGNNNRQVDSVLLQFAADYYGFDYLKLRRLSKPANKLDGYRSYAVNARNSEGVKVHTLIWFADFEFGSLIDGEIVDNSKYIQYMLDTLPKEIVDAYQTDYNAFVSDNPINEGM